MEYKELDISGAFVFTPNRYEDGRGEFYEWFKQPIFERVTGRFFEVKQANASVSKKGALRGIHFSDPNPGQAKYVTCPYGEVLDFVVDIRIGSPTFGQWDSVVLNGRNRHTLFIPEGLGHAFLSLEDNSLVSYLVTDVYRPENEHSINPFDSEINLDFSKHEVKHTSTKDLSAPLLSDLFAQGKLPQLQDCIKTYRRQSSSGAA